ncbi:nodulation protein NfeD [Candidatus Bipolaricaulota bacterium]
MMARSILLGLVCCCLVPLSLLAQGEAWVLKIDGEIGPGTVTYLHRGIAEATAAGAVVIALTLTTPGGLLDSAVEARRLLLESPLPTVAFVDGEALSAGALLAVSCKTILYAPGSVIGAATPVYFFESDMREAPEKTISAVRTLFRASAEFYGRRPDVAEAMVDRDVEIPDLIESGKLLTLTSLEAKGWGYSDGETADIETWLTDQGYDPITSFRVRWFDTLVDVLTSPLAIGLLITIGLLGMIAEMLIPGFGIPGLIGIACLGLFFWTHFLVGLASWESIAFLLGGVVAIGLEIFAFTAVDFGLAGLLGLVLIGLGFYTAMLGPFAGREQAIQAIAIVAAGLIVSVAAAVVLLTRLPRTRLRLGGIILSTAITGRSHDAGGSDQVEASAWVGRVGVTATDLRPVGSGMFAEERIDVVCEEGFLPKGTPIVVIRDDVYRKIVRRTEEERET